MCDYIDQGTTDMLGVADHGIFNHLHQSANLLTQLGALVLLLVMMKCDTSYLG